MAREARTRFGFLFLPFGFLPAGLRAAECDGDNLCRPKNL